MRRFLNYAPIVLLLGLLVGVLAFKGASDVADYGPVALLLAAACALIISFATGQLNMRELKIGMIRSSRQLLPAIPLLACIGLISTTWMLSGIVPLMVHYGINMLSQELFLFLACGVSALVSVMLGSSWTTIATVGVAFMGIGSVMGYGEGWIAGAIISGAYFGDKVSPLSDTTVIASSSCGVELFAHIRNLMRTSGPAITISLIIFLVAGMLHDAEPGAISSNIDEQIGQVFNLSPWLLVVPALTIVLCAMRMSSMKVLLISAGLGVVAMLSLQPAVTHSLSGGNGDVGDLTWGVMKMLTTSTQLPTGSETLDELVATEGVAGMLPTIRLVVCAMIFGGVMMGTGMLANIARDLTSKARSRKSIVALTTGTGLTLNSCTADQYLSVIVGSNMYRNAYRRLGLQPRLLSRTLEDSVTVTSVLIPWNSCGITQSTVLGVATLTYLPFCFFNYLSPILTILLASSAEKAGKIARMGHRSLVRVFAR